MYAPKFAPCNLCANGYHYSVNEFGEDVVIECDCHKKWYQDSLSFYRIEKAQLPQSILEYEIDDYQGSSESKVMIEHLKKYVEEFETKYYRYHLYFWSHENSTQKTTVASWIGKRLLIDYNKTVRFVLMNDLINLLMKVNYEGEAQLEMDEYLQCDFLIIDEAFDKSKVTLYKSGYQIPFLDSFLRKRMTTLSKATCFTSNIPIEHIESNFSISLRKLMQRSIVDPMHFKDEISIQALSHDRIESMWD